MQDKKKFYIGGEWVDPIEPKTMEVINPATEQPVAEISLGSAKDVDRAVTAARAAFSTWSETSVAERLELLEKLQKVMLGRMDDLAEAIRLEMGAPKSLASQAQAGSGPYHLKGFIDALKAFQFESDYNDRGERIVHEPIGVCGLITPWNWPINQIALKVIPAVAAGCTCILKPSEVAPLSGMVFAEMMDEAGLPGRGVQSGQW